MECSLDQRASPEEEDQRLRSVKKHKRDDPVADSDQDMPSALPEDAQAPPGVWGQASFVDVVHGRHKSLPFYIGEGEEDMLDDLSIAEVIQSPSQDVDHTNCPIVDVSWDEYRELWQPWRRALILKVLGRNISFRFLAPRIRRLWDLAHGCELVDLAKGFIIARFYSKEDYLKILNDGP